MNHKNHTSFGSHKSIFNKLSTTCLVKTTAVLIVMATIMSFISFSQTSYKISTKKLSEKAINACKSWDNMVTRFFLMEQTDKNQKLSREVIGNGFKVVSERHILKAYTISNEPDDLASVKQMDFGAIKGIFLDSKEGIIAIGDQTSYRVHVRKLSGKAKFFNLEELPTLNFEKCSYIKIIFGACQTVVAVFSKELKAAFTSGFDNFGNIRSYAFGLSFKNKTVELNTSGEGAMGYVVDIPGGGGVLVRSLISKEYYFFDGNYFYSCNF